MADKEDNIKEYYNLLVIRNHLAKIPKPQLIETYKNYDYYLAFLDLIGLLIENDSAFLLLDDIFLDKILSIIQIYRFETDNKEITEYINSVIDYINCIKSYPENLKNTLKNNYLAYQEEQRKAVFQSNEKLIESLAYDAIVFNALKEDKMETIEYDDHYILSLNFLMSTCKELFEDPKVKERAIKRLEQASSNYKVLSPKKKLVKQAKNTLERL